MSQPQSGRQAYQARSNEQTRQTGTGYSNHSVERGVHMQQDPHVAPLSGADMNQVYGDNLIEPMYQMALQDNGSHEDPYGQGRYEDPVPLGSPMRYTPTQGHDVMSPFHGFHRQGTGEGYLTQQQRLYPPSPYDRYGHVRTTDDVNIAQGSGTSYSMSFGGNHQQDYTRRPPATMPSHFEHGTAPGVQGSATDNSGSGSDFSIECPYGCGTVLTGVHALGNLTRHMNSQACTASGKEKRKYRCPMPSCGKEYTRSDGLKVHMRRRHEAPPPASNNHYSTQS